MAKKVCVRCGNPSDDLRTFEQYEEIVSESELLLKYYESQESNVPGQENGFAMSKSDVICWKCLSDDIIGYLSDDMDRTLEVQIRREVKETCGEDCTLYHIMNWALEFSCLNCGGPVTRSLDYSSLSPEMKRRAKRMMRENAITLKDSEKTVYVCSSCWRV